MNGVGRKTVETCFFEYSTRLYRGFHPAGLPLPGNAKDMKAFQEAADGSAKATRYLISKFYLTLFIRTLYDEIGFTTPLGVRAQALSQDQ
jgi:hypothetical protein